MVVLEAPSVLEEEEVVVVAAAGEEVEEEVVAAVVVLTVHVLLAVLVVLVAPVLVVEELVQVSRKALVSKPLKISPLPSEEIFLNEQNIHLSLLPLGPPKPDKPQQSHIDTVHIS